jgi:hypothetical protein
MDSFAIPYLLSGVHCGGGGTRQVRRRAEEEERKKADEAAAAREWILHNAASYGSYRRDDGERERREGGWDSTYD